MKVSEVVAMLLSVDQDLEVASSRDEEGNGYNWVNGFFLGYTDELLEWDPEIRFYDFDEDGEELYPPVLLPESKANVLCL